MAISRLDVAVLLALSLPAFAGEPRTARFEVSGMTCSLCPVTVRKVLERVPGVQAASADLATKSAQATYDPERTSPEALAKVVSDAGFPAVVAR